MNSVNAPKGKKEALMLKKELGVPRPLSAIRQRCLQCCVGSTAEIRKCHISDCALQAYRFGRSPKPEDLKVPVYDRVGELIGYEDWDGYYEKY